MAFAQTQSGATATTIAKTVLMKKAASTVQLASFVVLADLVSMSALDAMALGTVLMDQMSRTAVCCLTNGVELLASNTLF